MTRFEADISEEVELLEALRARSAQHDCIDADCDFNLRGQPLYEFNADGSRKKDGSGQPIRTEFKPDRATGWSNRMRALWRKHREKPI